MIGTARIIEGMSGRLVSPVVVGREREIATISRVLDDALAGNASHLLVAGEAGVGKSRLVSEAVRVAGERGMQVLRGACVNIGAAGVPYGPIVEVLRELHRELPPEDMADLVGPSGTDLARLLPALVADADLPEPSTQSQWLQARLLEALLGLVQRLADRKPLLLVVEDLHWADPGTRETLTYLVRNLRADAAVLLLTYRSDELHRRHPLLPWLAELERTGRVERVELTRLEPASTKELLAAILGGDPDRDLVDRVLERSDGNPFFIEELLMAEGASSDRGMPPTLRGILLARISALPEAAQSVVGVAAVAGRRVDHDLLATVAGQDESTTLAALRDAVGQQVLVADSVGGSDGYAFRHALMQEAAYEDLLPGERRRLHRAFAEAVAAAWSAREPMPPAIGRSSPTTGRRHATTPARSTRRSGRRRPRSTRMRSRTRSDTSRPRSTSGRASTTPERRRASTTPRCSTGRDDRVARWPDPTRGGASRGRDRRARRGRRPGAPRRCGTNDSAGNAGSPPIPPGHCAPTTRRSRWPRRRARRAPA